MTFQVENSRSLWEEDYTEIRPLFFSTMKWPEFSLHHLEATKGEAKEKGKGGETLKHKFLRGDLVYLRAEGLLQILE